MRVLALASAAFAMHPLGLAACHASPSYAAGSRDRDAPPKDEIWLSDEDLQRLHVTTEEVKLEDVDETIVTVGPVVDRAECPARQKPEAQTACVVVAAEQGSLARVHVKSAATARSAGSVHDVFPGEVAWIAGALDSSGRTVKLACVFPDPMAELRAGKQVRVELVVGAKPAFAVSRGAVMQTGDGSFVFSSAGSTNDGRHKFARVAVRAYGDTGGPWLPVADLPPGSLVVHDGTQALASMLTVTAL